VQRLWLAIIGIAAVLLDPLPDRALRVAHHAWWRRRARREDGGQ
jgi:hypothetical protein